MSPRGRSFLRRVEGPERIDGRTSLNPALGGPAATIPCAISAPGPIRLHPICRERLSQRECDLSFRLIQFNRFNRYQLQQRTAPPDRSPSGVLSASWNREYNSSL
ncbi:hypothetical protein BH23PLA1_BH23PLA1_00620 [soil metagenome]